MTDPCPEFPKPSVFAVWRWPRRTWYRVAMAYVLIIGLLMLLLRCGLLPYPVSLVASLIVFLPLRILGGVFELLFP